MMKKIITICAGLLLIWGSAVFAGDQHVTAALEHAKIAVEKGNASNAKELVKHANAALEHTLAAALVLKGQAKKHLEAASNELEEAATHGQLSRTESAVKHAADHAAAAVSHLQEANK
jgi:Small metal-binding protein